MWFASKNSCNEKKCAQFSWQVKHTSIQTGCTLKQPCEGGLVFNRKISRAYCLSYFCLERSARCSIDGCTVFCISGEKKADRVNWLYLLIDLFLAVAQNSHNSGDWWLPGEKTWWCQCAVHATPHVGLPGQCVCFCHGKCTIGACCNRVNSSHHVHQDIINVGSECHVVQRDYSYTELPD